MPGKSKYERNHEVYLPWFIILLTLLYLFIVVNLSYWVDIRFTNIFGLNDWLTSTYSDEYSILWVQIFREASLTERFQWLYIGISTILSIALFINSYREASKVFSAWLFMTIGIMIMFLEDVFNIRHLFTSFIASNYFKVPSTLEWVSDPRRMYLELVVYTILAAIMIIAYIYIVKDKKLGLFGKKLLTLGYLFYGIAAFASATRHLFGEWYIIVGRIALMRIYPEEWLPVIQTRDDLALRFMDDFVEESIELIGVSLILAALTVFITEYRRINVRTVKESPLD